MNGESFGGIRMRGTSRSIANRGVVNGDADFLMNRSVNNLILGINFTGTYLMENKETAKTYGRVSYKFMRRVMQINM